MLRARLAIAIGGVCLVLAAGCGRITAQAKNAEGVRLFNQGRFAEAANSFQEAANRDPANADAYYNMAAAYHRAGMFGQAEHYYHLCLDRQENHRDCYRGLTVLLAQQNRRDDAFRLLEGWADRQPLSAEPRVELARLFEECRDPAAARQQLSDALAIDHQNPRALAALGRLREQSGQYDQALADYRQSLMYDRFQSGLATRASALQSTLGQAPQPGGSWTASGSTPPLR